MTLAYETLLFDLDGTLSNPEKGITRSLNYALIEHGHAERSTQELATTIGPPLDVAFRQLLPGIKDEQVLALITSYRERFREIGYAENELYPHIPDILEKLRAKGYQLGLCTSKIPVFAEKILEHFGLHSFFTVVNGGDVGISKSDQIRALLIDEAITPNCLMIGDRAVDLTAAHENGLDSAGVLWGFGSRDELTAENPKYLLQTPQDLITL